jgi:5-methyltetrahydrofolate corrinoid/iron sulfur protein methyltransferase
MKENNQFTAIGENIHCTRVYKVNGRHVRPQADGSYAVEYSDDEGEQRLPIPRTFTAAGDWKAGKVKHVAVALNQALHGDSRTRGQGRRYLTYLARRQENCGAAYLDLNVDEFSNDPEARREAMSYAAEVLQEASSLPLSIDSSTVDLLKQGLAACDPGRGRPLLNSVSLEREEAIGLAAEAGAAVIAGAGGRERMPADSEERVANTAALMEKLLAVGLSADRIYIDPLVMPVSVNPDHGKIVLAALAELRRRYGPETRFAPGLSNISFGMPRRGLLNLVFADLCCIEGAAGGIVDPLQINTHTLAALDRNAESYRLARAFLTGEDSFGMSFIAAVREKRI